ncbi:MAG: TorF family putative porin [Erythrobacter sp.]
MLTSIRGLSAASISAGLLLAAAPAYASENSSEILANTDSQTQTADLSVLAEVEALTAETSTPEIKITAAPAVEKAVRPIEADEANAAEGEGPFTFSANVAFATEYRFRGVALTDGNFAVQGGFDLSHSSGLYVGTWGSNLDEDTVGFGSTELDVYGGWSGDLTGVLSADVGVILYVYPDAAAVVGDTDYVEFYGSLSAEVGPASLTGGVAYAPTQDSLGGTDNFYVYGDVGFGIPDTPFSVTGHVGYTDGFLTFTNDSQAFDWSITAEASFGPATLSAAYVGVEGDALIDPAGTFTDDAFVVTLSASF